MLASGYKTQETDSSVTDFVNKVENEQKRNDSFELIRIFKEATGHEPKMWGPSIIGFGSYDYKYDSGREGTSMSTGFSPRKAKLSLYLMGAYCTPEAQAEQDRLFGLLGKHSIGKSCLYINALDQVDMGVLEQLIKNNWDLMNEPYAK